MKILFDQGTPVPLRRYLLQHEVTTVYELGWSELANGELLEAAEAAGYELFLTTDQNLRHQQNLSQQQIAIAVLLSTSWPRISESVGAINEILSAIEPGEYVEIALAP